jgi:hypothetical protein
MKVHLASISTNEYEIENRIYIELSHSLEFIYVCLKSLTSDVIKDCDFFDREYIRNIFTKKYFIENIDCNCNINCRSAQYGDFTIKKIKQNKYQFVFIPTIIKQDEHFIVCELEILDLLD